MEMEGFDLHFSSLLEEKLWSGRCRDRRYSIYIILASRLQSSGPQPESEGFSHGLKKCPPDTFLPSLRSGRPFKSPSPISKESPPQRGGLSLLCFLDTIDIMLCKSMKLSIIRKIKRSFSLNLPGTICYQTINPISILLINISCPLLNFCISLWIIAYLCLVLL